LLDARGPYFRLEDLVAIESSALLPIIFRACIRVFFFIALGDDAACSRPLNSQNRATEDRGITFETRQFLSTP